MRISPASICSLRTARPLLCLPCRFSLLAGTVLPIDRWVAPIKTMAPNCSLAPLACRVASPYGSVGSSLMKMLRNWTQLGPPTQRPVASSNRP